VRRLPSNWSRTYTIFHISQLAGSNMKSPQHRLVIFASRCFSEECALCAGAGAGTVVCLLSQQAAVFIQCPLSLCWKRNLRTVYSNLHVVCLLSSFLLRGFNRPTPPVRVLLFIVASTASSSWKNGIRLAFFFYLHGFYTEYRTSWRLFNTGLHDFW
jgi:hypothetical protein